MAFGEEYFGSRDESRDKNFRRAFKMDTPLSKKEANEVWKKSIKELDSTGVRYCERENSLSLAFDSVLRYHTNFPAHMLNSTNLMAQLFQTNVPQNQKLSSNQLVDFIKAKSIQVLKITQDLYRECGLKYFELQRRRFAFGIRYMGYTTENIVEYIEKLISSSQEYQRFIEDVSVELDPKKNNLPPVIDAVKNMIEFYQKDIDSINIELEYYFTLKSQLETSQQASSHK